MIKFLRHNHEWKLLCSSNKSGHTISKGNFKKITAQMCAISQLWIKICQLYDAY